MLVDDTLLLVIDVGAPKRLIFGLHHMIRAR